LADAALKARDGRLARESSLFEFFACCRSHDDVVAHKIAIIGILIASGD
ncbi:MAG: hypothetical protein ACI9DF_005130, partial [Verrucomicrobiales bacterium]